MQKAIANLEEDSAAVDFRPGKLIVQRWRVIRKLGEGGCGTVYQVEEEKTREKAALKAEPNSTDDSGVLKLEAHILKKLNGKKFVAQLIDSGKRKNYSYIVMTLLGASFFSLLRTCKNEFSLSTQIRVGVGILYGLKQLHEIGYVHRDIKLSNIALGNAESEARRVVHLLDFGMCREYVVRSESERKIRKARTNILFRGTTKYCSISTHERKEQGRCDDLFSMIYILVEMRGVLPWSGINKESEICAIKTATSDEVLLSRCPSEMIEITKHLRTLDYYKRPNYKLIYEDILSKHKIKDSDPFDWELLEKQRSSAPVSSESSSGPNLNEDVLLKTAKDEEAPPLFTVEDFAKNEIGF